MKLDLNCEASYFPSFLHENEAKAIYQHLMTFKNLITKFSLKLANGTLYEENYGKMMFMDEVLFKQNKLLESMWGSNQIWSNKMLLLKNKIKEHTGHEFQTCVCIHYPDGSSGVDYHSDFMAFGDTTHIASISLGEVREFNFREKLTQKTTQLYLENGSLLWMGKCCQENYEHALPIDFKCKEPRINITFRKYGFKN